MVGNELATPSATVLGTGAMLMDAHPLQPGFAASQALQRKRRSGKAGRQEHRQEIARLLDMHGEPL
jgi:hypothetical protein